MSRSFFNKHRMNRLAGKIAGRYVRWVCATSKFLTPREDLHRIVRPHQPCIYAFWHGEFMLIAPLCPPDTPVANMVARHGDAELIGEVLKSFEQMTLIRGSGAGQRKKDRGGSTALREAVRALRSGTSIAMTADVPPGPARIASAGVIKLAQLSGCPILPVAVASSRFRTLRTWSRMTINLPFSNISMRIGDPLFVSRDVSDQAGEALRLKLQEALNSLTRQAYEDVGADYTKATPHTALPGDAPAEAAGLKLSTYRTTTRLAARAAPLILRHREGKGKEDPARRDELNGIASLPRPDGPLVWIHAASVGETNAILPLLGSLREQRPGIRFLLTTGTVTSAKLAADRLTAPDLHQYAPLDVPQYVEAFLDHWQPGLAILTESELWPNTILAGYNRGIPLAIVNGRMSERSYRRWRSHRSVAVPLFGRLRMVLAQNERLVRRFRDLGARDVRCTGNIKVDAPRLPVDLADREAIRNAVGKRPLWLAASTHPGEDETVIAAHGKLAPDHPGLLTIIAPRHPERGGRICELARAQGYRSVCRSGGDLPDANTEVYVADTIGELGLLYDLSQIVFVGGSLVSKGGQNPVEAVRFDAAVITGPDQSNFADAYRELQRRGGMVEVANETELAGTVSLLLRDEVERARLSRGAVAALEELSGGMQRTVDALLPLIPVAQKGVRRAS
jgi:3-deoxy-D-manno-octulosonic-acid transferase